MHGRPELRRAPSSEDLRHDETGAAREAFLAAGLSSMSKSMERGSRPGGRLLEGNLPIRVVLHPAERSAAYLELRP